VVPVDRHVPAQQVVGTAGGVRITITPQGQTAVRPGGPPMGFTLTLVDVANTDYAKIGMVVSLGHCSCTAGAGLMPAGSMQLFDPGTDAWTSVPYVVEGTGTDFLSQPLVPPFVLTHGQSVAYRLRLRLAPNQPIVKGASAVDVTMTNVTTNAAIGRSPTASLEVAVER
jgi:hypothetical protein